MSKLKIIFLLLFIMVVSFSCLEQKKRISKSENHLPVFIKNASSPDSGFITKKEGLPYLLNEKLTDTVNSFWNQAAESDTIGKFYRFEKSKSYFVSTINLSSKLTFETHLLFEISNHGKLLKSENFLHGNYPCCWNNYYEGFRKLGDYFSLRTCGTGSGFCSGKIYVFNKVIPQDQQKSIYESICVSMPEPKYLSSHMEIKNDSLIMDYKLEHGQFDDDGNYSVKNVEHFGVVKYFLMNNKWITSDSLLIEEFDIW